MNIAQALKNKNRLIGKINQLKQILNRDNSQKIKAPEEGKDVLFPEKEATYLTQCWEELEALRTELIHLKARITQASAPIARLLVELAETKDYISFLKSIPTREGEESLIHTTTNKCYVCFYDRKKIDELVRASEQRLYEIQDQIDDFNKNTLIPSDLEETHS